MIEMNTLDSNGRTKNKHMAHGSRLIPTPYDFLSPNKFLTDEFLAPLDTRMREAWSFTWDFLGSIMSTWEASMRCIFSFLDEWPVFDAVFEAAYIVLFLHRRDGRRGVF
jgi:hypothetical protein